MAQVKVIKAAKGFTRGKMQFTLNGLGDVQIAKIGGTTVALRENIPGAWFARSRNDGSGHFLTTSARIDRAQLEKSLEALKREHPEASDVFFTKPMPEELRPLVLSQTAGAPADALAAIGVTGDTKRFSTVEQDAPEYGIDEVTTTAQAGQKPIVYTRTAVNCRTRFIPEAGVALLRVRVADLAEAVAVRGDQGEAAEYIEIDGFIRAKAPQDPAPAQSASADA